jgi:hypothetical protein
MQHYYGSFLLEVTLLTPVNIQEFVYTRNSLAENENGPEVFKPSIDFIVTG